MDGVKSISESAILIVLFILQTRGVCSTHCVLFGTLVTSCAVAESYVGVSALLRRLAIMTTFSMLNAYCLISAKVASCFISFFNFAWINYFGPFQCMKFWKIVGSSDENFKNCPTKGSLPSLAVSKSLRLMLENF